MQQHIEYRVVNIKDLEPFPGNARRHDDGTLYNSVKAHGQYRTILVRQLETGEGEPERLQILAGHGTVEALDARNIMQARVEVCTCTDEEALQINLVDNRAPDKAWYDDDALAEQLRAAQEFSFEGTGWDEKSAAKYLEDMDKPDDGGPEGGPGEAEPQGWAIIVNCRDEEQQSDLLQKFSDEGLDCRALIN